MRKIGNHILKPALLIAGYLLSPLLSRAYVKAAARRQRMMDVTNPIRIGHLCIEVDCYLKDEVMAGRPIKDVILSEAGTGFANRHLVDAYYAQVFTVVEQHPVYRFAKRHGDPLHLLTPMHEYAEAMNKTCRAYETYAKWGNRAPLFELTGDDQTHLDEYLRKAGMRDGDWYVALHARGAGYSPNDEHMHTARNVDIESYELAIEEIIGRGGWCVRMGDATMAPIKPHQQLIDYALSAEKSDRLDVCLAAGCRFFLGSASGLVNLATLFGRPAALTNLILPISGAYPLCWHDISIPKKVRGIDGRDISIREMMLSDYANYRYPELLQKAGIVPVSNTPEEIRDLVAEMLDRLDGCFVETKADKKRQADFRALFHEGHYSYRSCGNVGRDFLRQNFQE